MPSARTVDISSLPEVETVTIEATRGADGLFGFQILSHPSLDVHNIVVVLEEGSAAQLDGLIRLGDIIIEVDGLRVDGVDMISAGALQHVKQSHQFTVRRFKSERDRRASLQATSPLDPSEVPTVRPSSSSCKLPLRLNLKSVAAAMSAPAAQQFELTSSTPRDVVFAQAAAMQHKYSAQAAAEEISMTPRTKGNQSGALSRARTAKTRRSSETSASGRLSAGSASSRLSAEATHPVLAH